MQLTWTDLALTNETQWMLNDGHRRAHARKGKETVSSQAAGAPANRDGSVQFLPFAPGRRPVPERDTTRADVRVRVFGFRFSSSRDARRTCARLTRTRNYGGG